MKKDTHTPKTQVGAIHTTKQQSDTSILSQEATYSIDYYQKHLRILNQEIKFQKNAIITAQQLIQNYAQENLRVNRENQQLKLNIGVLKNKLYNVETLLVKIISNDKKTQNFMRNKENNIDNNLQNSFFSQSLMKKLQDVLQKQSDYQNQILKLNKKIKKLQKSELNSLDPKSAIINHFNALQSKMFDNHQLDLKIKYGFQKNKEKDSEKCSQKCISTSRTLKNNEKIKRSQSKVSRLKTQIQKQFQVFVKHQKNTPKSVKNRSISQSRSRARIQRQISKNN